MQEPLPIGKNRFGNVYQWALGKAKEAAQFLRRHKDSYLKGVFHRDDIGDIDLVWGDDKAGLKHIIEKHIVAHDDFNSIDEAVEAIEETIKNGQLTQYKNDGNYRIVGDKYNVVIAKSTDGNWVITAFDNTRPLEEKKRNEATATLLDQSGAQEKNGTLVSSQPHSESKGTQNNPNAQEDDAQFSDEDVNATVTDIYKRLQKQKELAAKPISLIDQKAVAKREAAKQEIERLQQLYDHWNAIKTRRTEAKAAEVRQRIEQNEKKREERRQTQPSQQPSNATPAERWQASPKVVGNAVTRTLADGTVIKGHYVLAEAGAATPSHDPSNGWNTSDGFPVTEDGKNINDRDYKNDTDAQQITEQMARTYDGQAVAQVPVVSSEGIVYDGNGRTIAGNMAAANNTDGAYIQALADNAGNFGFTEEQVAGMRHPRVYMQTDENLTYNTTTFAKFNAQEKKTQSSTDRAVSGGKKLTEAARDGLLRILDNYGTLDAFFASETGAKDVVRSLLDNGIITQQEVAGLTEATDRGFVLSPAGKDYVTDLLIGGLFDEQTIRMLGNDKGLKQAILRALPSIVENRRLGDYALTNEINSAIRLLYEARQAGMAYSLYVKQGNAFEGYVSDRFPPFEMLLAEEMSSGVETFRQVLNLYNNSARDEANGQARLFEPRSVEDIKNEILQHYANRKQQPTAAEPTIRPANAQTQPPLPSAPAGTRQEQDATDIPASNILEQIEAEAEPFEEIELTPANWYALFGEDGIVSTPIGYVKMGEHQYLKLAQKGRDGKLGMIKPTLEHPSVVVMDKSQAKDGQTTEREFSYVFVKAFVGKNGERLYYFTSITVSKDGQEVVVSNQEKERSRIQRLLKNGKLAYINKATLPPASDKTIQGDQLTNPVGDDSKGTTNIPNQQTSEQKSAENAETDATPIQSADDLIARIDETLADIASTRVGYLKVLDLLDINEDASREFLKRNNIAKHDELEAWCKKRQAKLRKGTNKKRREALAQTNVDRILDMAQKAEAEFEQRAEAENANPSGNKLLSEREFVEKRMDEAFAARKDKTQSREDFDLSDEATDTENAAIDGYVSYIKSLLDSGEMQEMYNNSTISERIKIARCIETAGFEVDDYIDKSKINAEAKRKRDETKRRKTEAAMRKIGLDAFVEKMTGKGVNLVQDPSQLPRSEGTAYRAIKGGAKVMGWFNVKTGQVYIYTPNAGNRDEVMRTLLHEFVAHKGLRDMLGAEAFDKLCRNVWKMMPFERRVQFAVYVTQRIPVGTREMRDYTARLSPYDLATLLGGEKTQLAAADEYMAHFAEKGVTEQERSVWQQIADAIRKLLRRIGFGVPLQDSDIARLLYESKNRLTQDMNLEEMANATLKLNATTDGFAKGGQQRNATQDHIRFSLKEANDRFNAELQRQIDGTLPQGHIYQLGMPNTVLRSTGIPYLPIQMSAKKLQEKATMFGHNYNLTEVRDLVKALQHPLAIFAYGNKEKGQNIIVSLQKDGNNFVVGLSLNPIVNGRTLEINSIRNVFPKDNAEWLNWISQGKALYLDKEKIQSLIDQQRTILADVGYLDLDSTAKVVKDFENPKLSAGNDVRFSIGTTLETDKTLTKEARKEMQAIADQAKADGTYMQAPNGNPSNLNERQWLQVRTRAFKRWFGDWEKAAKAKYLLGNKYVKILTGTEFQKDETPITKKVAQYYNDKFGGRIERKNFGEVILDERSVKDSIAHGIGRAKSAAFAAVPEIIRDGVEIDTQENWKGRNRDSYTFAAPVEIGGKAYVGVVIVTRGAVNGDNRFYLHEVILQENLQSERIKTDNKADAHNGDIAKVLKDIVSAIENSSKVVDENGEPLVVYHGTDYAGFTKFRNSEHGIFFSSLDRASWYVKGNDNPRLFRFAPTFDSWDALEDYAIKNDISFEKANEEEYDFGYFVDGEFVDDLKRARDIIQEVQNRRQNSGNIYAVFLNIKNPKRKDAKGKYSLDYDQLSHGKRNDGVIVENINDPTYDDGSDFEDTNFIAFSPNQIKSATANNGTFSNGSDDIRFSIGGGESAAVEREAAEAVLDLLEKAGLKPHMVSEEEAQRVLGMLGENTKTNWSDALSAIAATSHTITGTGTHGQSSNSKDGAKVQQNLDITKSLNELAEALSGEEAYTPQEFVGQIALALGIKDASTSKSNYAAITLGNGTTANVRISNHQGNAINFTIKGKGGEVNIGFVIKSSKTAFRSDDNSNYVEFVYYGDKTTEAARQRAIVDGIRHLVETGEFGQIPQADRVNTSGAFHAQAQIAYHGSGANFEAFDHSHMGEGEGAQAYGWGTYVTEVEGIGKTYAKQNTTKHNDALRALQHDVDAISGQLYRHRDGLKYNEEQLKRANDRRAEAELGYELFQEKAEELKKKYGEASPEYQNHLFYDIYTDEMKRAQRSVKNIEEDIQYRKEEIAELEKALKDKQAEIDKLPEKFPRHLYTVEIPDDTGENYLDWNKKYQDGELDALLDRIGDALAKQGIDLDKEHNGHASWNTWRERLRTEGEDWEPDTATGKAIYEKVSLMFGGSPYDVYMGKPREASRFLSKVGFTGIKYPADNLRGGREDGARNYVVFDENDLQIKHHARFLRTQTGTIYGWTSGGEIYLVEGRLNPDTPLHEYTHLWDAACRRTNPELWRRGVELMKRTPLWDEVKNDPNYADLTTDDEIAGEAHARLSGRDGAALLERMAEEAEKMDAMAMTERLGLVARLKKWMQDFWRWTRDTFAPWTKAEAAEVSLDDFVRMPLADLVRGVNPNEAGRSAEADGGVQFMGSRVDRRMGEIADHYDGRELTDEQQAIVDVFGGERSNASVAFTDGSGQGRTLHVRSGNENRGGVKHAIYRHYNGGQGRFEADDIAKIPTVLEQGQRTEKGDGRVEYAYTDEDGVKYTVGTEMRNGIENFVTFYTNKEASLTTSQNTQLSAQEKNDATNPSAKVGESSETAKSDDGIRFSIGGGESAAVEREAAEAVLDLLEKAGLKPHMVSEEEAQRVLAEKNGDVERMAVTEKFNDTLARYTDENADNIKFDCGMPSDALLMAGMPNVGIRLRGEVLRKKMKAHQFAKEDIRNLPLYMQNPIAVFEGSHDNTFAVLTEMVVNGRNTLVAIDIKEAEIRDFVEVSSLYDKNKASVITWINNGKLLSVDKEKALRYIDSDAPIAPIGNNKGASSAAKVVQNFDSSKSFVGKPTAPTEFYISRRSPYMNSGYTEREDGTSVSVRALEAEENGTFSAGTFRKKYGVSTKAFNTLLELGIIKNTEWHHTGKSFKQTEFYSWEDSDRAGGHADYSNAQCEEGSIGHIYAENKKAIDKLVDDYLGKEFKFKHMKNIERIPTFEEYMSESFRADEWLTDDEKDERRKQQRAISEGGWELGTAYERREMHQRVDERFRETAYGRYKETEDELRAKYDDEYREARARNAEAEEYNGAIKGYNLDTDGAEKALIDLLETFGIDSDRAHEKADFVSVEAQKAKEREQREQRYNEWKERQQALIREVEKKRDAWIAKKLKDGSIERLSRISESGKPQFFAVEKEEMYGKYGWFAASYYNLPIYYSGLDLKNARNANTYKKYEDEIWRLRSERYEDGNGAPQFLHSTDGTVYGWTSGGEIYLVESRLNPDTPLHEYTHLWDAVCRRTNPELWRRGVELMKRTPLWDEVKNDPNYADLTTDDEIAGEAHARLSGRDGAALLDRMAEEAAEMDAMAMTERLGLVARLKKWMQDFWRWTRDTFAPWTKAEAAEVSLEDFVRMPLADLVRGVNPNEAGRNGGLEAVNRRFNEALERLTEDNADRVALNLGRPSDILLAAGVADKPMKLYGSKVIKKMREHRFGLNEIKDLPRAVADPIAVFDNYQTDGNRSILTELATEQGNFLVAVNIGKNVDVDFNIVASVFGKGENNVVDWINSGYATYINKEKALAFLFHQSAPIAATAANEELSRAAKVVKDFENPSVGDGNLYGGIRFSIDGGAEGKVAPEAVPQELVEQIQPDEDITKYAVRLNATMNGYTQERLQQIFEETNRRMAMGGRWYASLYKHMYDKYRPLERFQKALAF